MSRNEAQAPAARCLAVWLAVTGSAWLVLGWLAGDLESARTLIAAGDLSAVRFDEALTLLAAAAVTVCVLWFWLVTTSVALTAARGASLTGVSLACPRPLQRLLLAACGAALVGGLAAPALAVDTSITEDGDAGIVEGLALPDRASLSDVRAGRSRAPRRPDARAGRAQKTATTPRTVEVTAGDSLWSLASATLPDDATDAEVTRRWHAIYRTNRGAIGADPDLIFPTDTLRLPGERKDS